MITKYQYNNITYDTFAKIRQIFPNVSFTETITQETLSPLDVTIVQEVDPIYTPTQGEIIKAYTDGVESYLDSTAHQRNYDGILSLCTYATSTNPTFAKEGQAGVIWRDSVWAKCYAILAEVKAGTRATPTTEEVLAELPVFTWGD